MYECALARKRGLYWSKKNETFYPFPLFPGILICLLIAAPISLIPLYLVFTVNRAIPDIVFLGALPVVFLVYLLWLPIHEKAFVSSRARLNKKKRRAICSSFLIITMAAAMAFTTVYTVSRLISQGHSYRPLLLGEILLCVLIVVFCCVPFGALRVDNSDRMFLSGALACFLIAGGLPLHKLQTEQFSSDPLSRYPYLLYMMIFLSCFTLLWALMANISQSFPELDYRLLALLCLFFSFFPVLIVSAVWITTGDATLTGTGYTIAFGMLGAFGVLAFNKCRVIVLRMLEEDSLVAGLPLTWGQFVMLHVPIPSVAFWLNAALLFAGLVLCLVLFWFTTYNDSGKFTLLGLMAGLPSFCFWGYKTTFNKKFRIATWLLVVALFGLGSASLYFEYLPTIYDPTVRTFTIIPLLLLVLLTVIWKVSERVCVSYLSARLAMHRRLSMLPNSIAFPRHLCSGGRSLSRRFGGRFVRCDFVLLVHMVPRGVGDSLLSRHQHQ